MLSFLFKCIKTVGKIKEGKLGCWLLQIGYLPDDQLPATSI